MASWEKHLSDYEIIEWNEENFDIDMHPYVKKAYMEGHWAFVADYVRLWVLEKYGGIYLDTDMEVIRSLNPLRKHQFFIGKENNEFISAGIIGSIKGHKLLKLILKRYDNLQDYETIPKIITQTIEENITDEIEIYEPVYFYPYYPFGEDAETDIDL